METTRNKDQKGFGARLQKYFFDDLGIKSQRDVSKLLGNYSETNLSRIFKQEKTNFKFITLIKDKIPNANVKYLMGDLLEDLTVNEPPELYGKERIKLQLIEDIESKCKQLKELITQ